MRKRGSCRAFPSLGIGFAGVSLAFGLTVLTGAYALGHISGAHFNPAVTFGLWAGKRFPANEIVPYVIAQVLGAIAGAGVLYLIASGKAGFSFAGGFASNGFAAHSPGQYSVVVLLCLRSRDDLLFPRRDPRFDAWKAPKGFAPLAIGLSLTLIHLISIPVTNTSVNPARSTGPALFVAIYSDPWPVKQLWLFWIAPILGALLAGFFYSWLGEDEVPLAEPVVGEGASTRVVEVIEE